MRLGEPTGAVNDRCKSQGEGQPYVKQVAPRGHTAGQHTTNAIVNSGPITADRQVGQTRAANKADMSPTALDRTEQR